MKKIILKFPFSNSLVLSLFNSKKKKNEWKKFVEKIDYKLTDNDLLCIHFIIDFSINFLKIDQNPNEKLVELSSIENDQFSTHFFQISAPSPVLRLKLSYHRPRRASTYAPRRLPFPIGDHFHKVFGIEKHMPITSTSQSLSKKIQLLFNQNWHLIYDYNNSENQIRYFCHSNRPSRWKVLFYNCTSASYHGAVIAKQ